MTNLPKIFTGITIYIAAFIASILLEQLIPPLIDTLTTLINLGDEIEAIIYFGTQIAIILAYTIAPSYYIITGLIEKKEDEGQPNSIGNTIAAAIIFVFGILITIKIAGWIPTFTAQIESTTVLVAFWIGLIAMWIEIILITPYYLITQAFQKQ